jgi:hypothetical protein
MSKCKKTCWNVKKMLNWVDTDILVFFFVIDIKIENNKIYE